MEKKDPRGRAGEQKGGSRTSQIKAGMQASLDHIPPC